MENEMENKMGQNGYYSMSTSQKNPVVSRTCRDKAEYSSSTMGHCVLYNIYTGALAEN